MPKEIKNSKLDFQLLRKTIFNQTKKKIKYYKCKSKPYSSSRG